MSATKTSKTTQSKNPEQSRLTQDGAREKNWKRWGPYLSERQWGTVREDYSPDGECWDYFSHDQATSRTYRWGEDGLLGLTDRQCRLCFGLSLWNGEDPILKERLYGLTGPEGNHGEDCKELYYYQASTPTHSYLKSLYKYPQKAFPYEDLKQGNQNRGLNDKEYEILDTGIFENNRYWDVSCEYAKNAPDDILIKITLANRGDAEATIDLLPTLWFRNTWIWGCEHDGCSLKPSIKKIGSGEAVTDHETLGKMHFWAEDSDALLFTENETNTEKLFGSPTYTPYVKDAFHRYVIHGQTDSINPKEKGTKCAAHYRITVPARSEKTIRLRLSHESEKPKKPFGAAFEKIFAQRIQEMETFYENITHDKLSPEENQVLHQAYAGLLHSKQFYHYAVKDWLQGDPDLPAPPEERQQGRNNQWGNLFSRDIISMPDKWEYPWFAAWDLAFHMIAFNKIDPAFAKEQLILMLREWYMHPNGQIPAYEFNFGDVNPPVHAWAVWRIYKMTDERGHRDFDFLAQCFHKLLINFTWWINRKDPDGKNLFSGGFLGLDNIGAFDRSKPLPGGGHLEQADGTAWMAFYCSTMLSIALELASHDPSYEGVASKFFEHFISIAEAMNKLGDHGLWDETDGFYYDQLKVDGKTIPLAIRSLVGLLPLCAIEVLDYKVIERLPRFKKRMDWFLDHNDDLSNTITCQKEAGDCKDSPKMLLSIVSKDRLQRILNYLLDEKEFLSPYGIRSLSKYHEKHPYNFTYNEFNNQVGYVPGESDSWLFGGNSNWRGPIWFPVNYILLEALEKYHHFFGDDLQVAYPTGSENMLTLDKVAEQIAQRLTDIFLPDSQGNRPINRDHAEWYRDPYFQEHILFYEYFHGDTGRGLGASHQTGWTGLVAKLLEDRAKHQK